ncbi:MAG: chorismate synthase [SAR324 cluster bacterium]|jgi:chorismate synthase|nr:chorismate synthase [SAR324 cluster bacterium]MEE1575417.1 chorismate synthase [Deltaproteobacteria bacterium]MDP6639387.1 chorismate synthase [SAR324 cluster bacterium]MDP7138043.1 chorismate synthase [SAR324 cluster bacterium]MDP7334645.1 chorismate synthase [SAR324 cluster bacterium]|tara:strand:+ start:10800 stop:11882 length:1083 start_codon:yes stop_codon:yes gene_type:complete
MGDSFGHLFRITTWGESHGRGVGVVIDGCPAGLEISEAEIQYELDRRRPGQSKITTQRKESDSARILSGTFEGKTTGTAISIMVENQDARPQAYDHLKDLYRPSHADYTYEAKYGIRNWMGGGRASARETIGRVAAGALAKKLLKHWNGTQTLAWVEQIHTLRADINPSTVTEEQIEQSIVRCPNPEASKAMEQRILDVRKKGDSVGGIIRAMSRNVPVGLGEPVFDKLTADLAKALMSLPATRGVEFGLGFQSVSLSGSEHNDAYVIKDGEVRTRSNRSAGIQGGISNGEDIDLRIAFKPTATINHEQETVTRNAKSTTFQAKGRHDPCVLPRAVPMVEAMIHLVLADHYLRQNSSRLG